MHKSAKLLHAAIALHQSGQTEDAEKAYRKVLRRNAVHPDGLRLLGALYLQTGRIRQAAEILAKAAHVVPNDAETLTNLGLSLWRLECVDEAAARLEQALSCRDDYYPALSHLAHLSQARGDAEKAALCFEKMLRLSPLDAAAHYHYGNCLMGAHKCAEAIACYEAAIKIKPDFYEAMINLGIAYSMAGKANRSGEALRKARHWLEEALKTDPDSPTAMNNLGIVLRQLGETEQAAALFESALQKRPAYAEAMINLATSLRDLGQIDKALERIRAALALKPDLADSHTNLGVFLQEQGRHEEALSAFTQALRLSPCSIDAVWNKALSLLALGHYREGWALHETGLGVPHMRGATLPDRRWQGEDLTGKRLLIRCEQGLGDNLQFIRYAELCKEKGARVIVQCPDALRSLFSNCPYIDGLCAAAETPEFDCHAPIMSLPFIFNTEIETIPRRFPYVHVGEAARRKWAGRFPKGGFKVGLVWAGNPREELQGAHLVDRRRSMDLENLRPLFEGAGISFYSLQMGAKAAQIDSCGLRDRLIDFMADVKDFEDTAAMIEHLDLVISVDTSVAHLAGGMGKPVWVLSRFDACWRWLQNRPDNPWYPSARVFGQTTRGDWDGVVARVKEALAKKALP